MDRKRKLQNEKQSTNSKIQSNSSKEEQNYVFNVGCFDKKLFEEFEEKFYKIADIEILSEVQIKCEDPDIKWINQADEIWEEHEATTSTSSLQYSDDIKMIPEVEVKCERLTESPDTIETISRQVGEADGTGEDHNVTSKSKQNTKDMTCKTKLRCQCRSCETIRQQPKDRHKNNEEYKCVSCKEVVNTRLSLTQHYLNKHGLMGSYFRSIPFVCKICNYTCIHKYVLAAHMRHHSGERPYECPTCDHTATSRDSINQHIKTHSQDKRKIIFECEYCNQKFKDVRNLKEHSSALHASVKSVFKCDICHYSNRTKRGLYLHLRNFHKKKIHCDFCPFKTCVQKDFDGHMESHKDTSSICGYKSSDSKDLSDHIASIHWSKTYECDYCGSHFIYKKTLRRHIASLCKMRICYKCDLCNREYVGLRHFKNHKCNTNLNVIAKSKLEPRPLEHTLVKQIKNVCDKEIRVRLERSLQDMASKTKLLCRCRSCKIMRQQQKDRHKNTNEYKCVSCKEVVNTHSSLTQHYMNKHGLIGNTLCSIPYVCKICNYTCLRWNNLAVHMRCHSGERPFECPTCSHTASKRSCINEHIKTHSQDKRGRTFQCEYCKRKYKNGKTLKEHISILHSMVKSVFKCEICDHKTMTKSGLYLHLRKIHKKKFQCAFCQFKTCVQKNFDGHMESHKDTCSICGYKSSDSKDLSDHIASIHWSKTYECDYCGSHFVYKKTLRKHIKSLCKMRICYMCDFCNREYVGLSHFKMHKCNTLEFRSLENTFAEQIQNISKKEIGDRLKRSSEDMSSKTKLQCQCSSCKIIRQQQKYRHKNTNEYKCVSCKEVVNTHSSLTQHYMNKHGLMGNFLRSIPFVCKICNYTCINKYILAIHMRHHSGERPYKCPTCDHTAISKTCIDQHIRTHSESNKEIIFECEYCKRKFYGVQSLKDHISTIHSTVKSVFKCDHCGHTTATKYNLYRHLREVHNNKFQCSFCSFKTCVTKDFDGHMKLHKETCSICGYKSSDSKDLSEHITSIHWSKTIDK